MEQLIVKRRVLVTTAMFSEHQRDIIKRRKADGEKTRALGREYGVDPTTIARIR